MSCYSSICLAAYVRFVSGFFALMQHLFLNEAKKGKFLNHFKVSVMVCCSQGLLKTTEK